MEKQFGTFAIWLEDPMGGIERSIMVACKDREATDERWVLSPLTSEDAKQLYEWLKQYYG